MDETDKTAKLRVNVNCFAIKNQHVQMVWHNDATDTPNNDKKEILFEWKGFEDHELDY